MLKLCTCSNTNTNTATWSIKRMENVDWMDVEQGRCVSLIYSKNQIVEIDAIVKMLNSRNCFDFDFKPKTGDILTLNMKDKLNYQLEFKDMKWCALDYLDDFYDKKYTIKKGEIECDAPNFENH